MEALKRARRLVRRDLEKLMVELEALLNSPTKDSKLISATANMFESKYESLLNHDTDIIKQLVADNVSEEEENKECDEIREWTKRAELLRQLREEKIPSYPHQSYDAESVTGASMSGDFKVRGFKLKPLEIRKFTGDIKDWLGFWAQFERIHEDPRLTGSDKLSYLLQSIEPKTDAYEMVKLYPASNENYDLVIASLKKHYADKDRQLQVYIRELLELMINNRNAKEKQSVRSIFVKVDAHLRALKTLEINKADPEIMLFPLVESCFPEHILYNFRKDPISKVDGRNEEPPRTKVDMLMSFVEQEVFIQQDLDLANNFANPKQGESSEIKTPNRDRRLLPKERKTEKRTAVPTLSSFHNAEKKSCGFCDRTGHGPNDCHKAKNMTLAERRSVLRKKNLCIFCAEAHRKIRFSCPSYVQCGRCKKMHLTIQCTDVRSELEGRRASGSSTQAVNFNSSSIKRKSSEDSRGMGAPDAKRPSPETETITRVVNQSNLESTSVIALQTLLVKVSNGRKSKIVRAFVDSGSQRSYLLQTTTKELGMKSVGVEDVIHSLFGGRQTKIVKHNKYNVMLSSVNGEYSDTFEIRDQDEICDDLPQTAIDYPSIMEELKEKNVTLTDVDDSKKRIELLIGADVYASIVTGEIKKLQRKAVAVNTELGWTILGKMNESNSEEGAVAAYIAMSTQDANIAKLWELEVIGVENPSQEKSEKKRLELETEKFLENISRGEEGRYSVKMPWKQNLSHLPSNRQVAYQRLINASKKLIDKGMFKAYNDILQDWERAKFIERVSVNCETDKLHYLPHRAVIKDSLTTPVRPVFDASCRVGKAPSLNECLFTGENYVKAIPDLILRFREKKIGFVSDIRKAFQMIEVDEEDRDAMRFLWWKDQEMKELIEFRHSRVMFGATCSPFILGVVLFHHLTNLPEGKRELGMKILATLYVDNCVSSETTPQRYRDFRREATELLASAGMDLRMWLSNIDEFEDEATHVVSVLGLLWDRKTDELFVKIKDAPLPEKVTKRVVLSSLAQIYDPIGFTAPAVLPMKILLQRVWNQKKKWDAELNDEDNRAFLKWRKEIGDLGKIRLPRVSTAGIENREKWTLHTFTDASKDAYAAVVFLRVEKSDGSVEVQLLAAKSRVAPIKTILTIPKLELMGCLLGKRLAAAVRKALGMEGVKEFFRRSKGVKERRRFVKERVVRSGDMSPENSIPLTFHREDVPLQNYYHQSGGKGQLGFISKKNFGRTPWEK